MVNLAIESYAKIIIAIFFIFIVSALIVYITGIYKSFIKSKFSGNSTYVYANVRRNDFMKMLYSCWQLGKHSKTNNEIKCYTVSIKNRINKTDIESFAYDSGVPVDMNTVPSTIYPGDIVVIYYKSGLVRLRVYT